MPTLRDLATSPWLRDVCRDLIGPDVNLYWDQAVYKKPEKPRRFPWHRDNGPDAPVEVPADAPDRQFPVLRDGRAVGHPTS